MCNQLIDVEDVPVSYFTFSKKYFPLVGSGSIDTGKIGIGRPERGDFYIGHRELQEIEGAGPTKTTYV